MSKRRGRPRKSTSAGAGRHQTRKAYPLEGKKCRRCGKPAQVRHHRDGNTHNLAQTNVMTLCRSCHVTVDPRIKAH